MNTVTVKEYISCTFCTKEKIKTIRVNGNKIYLCESCLITFKQ